ncbi:hypothetical protein B0H17DRAFT_1137647 [Mycena rosella]|uniref:Ankyrin repeat protein n=1 Tax=Mycena rosella TaxID=1033263 RepID=A0AAD7D7V0_MYCRO|nr:hypothetical protein B0H17DRAFT_1137647 [Mycena rosella]
MSQLGNYSAFAALIAHGCKLIPSEEDIQRAFAASPQYSYVPDKQYFHPLEAALSRHDDIIRLLADLGAEINMGTKRALSMNSRPEDRRTYVEWVQNAVASLSVQISELNSSINPPEVVDSDAHPGFKAHLAAHLAKEKASLATWQKTHIGALSYGEQRRARLIDVREYLTDTEKFLLERGAKPWSAVYPDNVSTASDPKINQFGEVNVLFGRRNKSISSTVNYYSLKGPYDQEAVPAFQDTLYDELYEACFIGDNDKVQELCLPAGKPKKDANLIQIAVQVAAEDGNRYSQTGVTPLWAAVAGRRWDTARLVVAITSAQYKPAVQTGRFNTSDIALDDDSDNESDDSNDSEGTVEQDTINFVDIASRPSTVECNAHPRRLLDARPGLLTKTIIDDDFEAFINVLNLYKHSPKHVEFPADTLSSIISHDRADMLDEYIRRTGLGLKIHAPTQNVGDEDIPIVNDKNKKYLGLTVHGKKRTDLAKRNDPDAAQTVEKVEVPLVWQAVLGGAKTSILNYLLGDRPLVAYKFYASSNSTDSARVLNRTTDLAKVLPEWLGWAITPLGESPLIAAIASKKLEIVKYLFEKSPRLMASSLHQRVKFLGINPLMFAVQLGCDASIIDFLLAKSISPAERDQTRGWNIFHHLCDKNHHELLKHLLNKLPRDVVEALLAQQSKERLNTPLHLCAKKGFKNAVKLVAEFSKSSVLVRDVDGSIPLHCAVRSGFSETIQILVDAAPSGLHMENGVGETPLDIASLQDLIERNQKLEYQQNVGGSELQNVTDQPPRLNIDRLDVELPQFRTTLETLVRDGVLNKGTKMATDMFAFAEQMEWKLVAAKAARNVDAVTDSGQESGNISKALTNVKAAMNIVDGRRELVHLVDVQTSVQSGLSRHQSPPIDSSSSRNRYRNRNRTRDDEEGLEPEEDAEQKELRGSFVSGYVQTGADTA